MNKLFPTLVLLLSLMMISIAFASIEPSPTAGTQKRKASTSQSMTAPQNDQARTAKGKAILTQTDAEALRAQGDSLSADSGVDEVAVGEGVGSGLLYVLVVVLLVVVILAVLR